MSKTSSRISTRSGSSASSRVKRKTVAARVAVKDKAAQASTPSRRRRWPTNTKLPGRFSDLSRMAPLKAIADEGEHEVMLNRADQMMLLPKLTRGQSDYLETLVQLIEAYEARHHSIDNNAIRGVELLRRLLQEHDLSGAALGRVLGVDASTSSKILGGQRRLTLDHVKRLSEHFGVGVAAFV